MSIKPKERERQMKIENTCSPKSGNIGIEKMSITYSQESDTLLANDDYQFLTIEAQPVDDGYFLTLTTERWAIDDPEEISQVLEDFNSRLKV